MRKKSPKVSFKIALTVFCSFAKAKINFMMRDLAEFIKFGITEEKITALDDLVTAYEEIPTDEELLGGQVEATQAKDALAEQLREAMAAILTRAENRFGFDSSKYRRFGVSSISTLNGGELSYSSGRVRRVALSYLSELESEGLTTEILDGFKLLRDSYKQALIAQEDAIANREIATEDRVEKANAIYKLLVKYCDTGKRIWESVNQAKYNDYIIYDTPSGQPGAAA